MSRRFESEGNPGASAESDSLASAPPRWLGRLGLALFGWVTSTAVRLLGATWRVETLGADPRRAPAAPRGAPRAQLAALLHASLVVSAWLFRDEGYCVAVSRSRDGSLVAATLRALGYADPARGSSSRGGSAAMMGLLRRLEAGTTAAVLVDGPRGPAGVAKPGIAALARLSATPIQPVAVAARPALRLRSWDRSLVPLPFARVVCAFGEPLPPATGGGEEPDRAIAREVETRLAALQREAETRLGRR